LKGVFVGNMFPASRWLSGSWMKAAFTRRSAQFGEPPLGSGLELHAVDA
jgi:hypothetical protein